MGPETREDPSRRSVGLLRAVIVSAVLALLLALVAGCSTHDEPLTRACPTVAGRGVAALPKLGLSADELKVQEKC